MWFVQVKLLSTYLVFALALICSRCSKDQPSHELREESTHFIILTNSKNSTSDEISQVITQAENLYERILNILGEERAPTHRITIRMEGPFEDQGPYFDNQGIHLFRYSAEENGYLSLLAHEMAHAFRESFYLEKQTWNWSTYGYFDEGFAEYIARLIDSTKTGFPFYGFPENVVVGDMVSHGKDLPHDELRNRHEELNQPCNIQTYPLRASWCRFVNDVYGRDALFSIVFADEEPTSPVVQQLTGADLPTLDAEWRNWVLEKYQDINNANHIAQGYLERVSWYFAILEGVIEESTITKSPQTKLLFLIYFGSRVIT